MSNSVNSIQTAQSKAQAEQTVQAPKKPQETTKATVQQDTVTISKASQQALATNRRLSANDDLDHGGDSK